MKQQKEYRKFIRKFCSPEAYIKINRKNWDIVKFASKKSLDYWINKLTNESLLLLLGIPECLSKKYWDIDYLLNIGLDPFELSISLEMFSRDILTILDKKIKRNMSKMESISSLKSGKLEIDVYKHFPQIREIIYIRPLFIQNNEPTHYLCLSCKDLKLDYKTLSSLNMTLNLSALYYAFQSHPIQRRKRFSVSFFNEKIGMFEFQINPPLLRSFAPQEDFGWSLGIRYAESSKEVMENLKNSIKEFMLPLNGTTKELLIKLLKSFMKFKPHIDDSYDFIVINNLEEISNVFGFVQDNTLLTSLYWIIYCFNLEIKKILHDSKCDNLRRRYIEYLWARDIVLDPDYFLLSHDEDLLKLWPRSREFIINKVFYNLLVKYNLPPEEDPLKADVICARGRIIYVTDCKTGRLRTSELKNLRNRAKKLCKILSHIGFKDHIILPIVIVPYQFNDWANNGKEWGKYTEFCYVIGYYFAESWLQMLSEYIEANLDILLSNYPQKIVFMGYEIPVFVTTYS